MKFMKIVTVVVIWEIRLKNNLSTVTVGGTMSPTVTVGGTLSPTVTVGGTMSPTVTVGGTRSPKWWHCSLFQKPLEL